MSDTLGTIAILLLAAAAGEGINEFFMLPFLDMIKQKYEAKLQERGREWPQWAETLRIQIYRLWSGAVGIGIAWELQLDIFGLLGVWPLHPIVGNIITGLLIGRGSNYLHDLIKKWVQPKPPTLTVFK